MAESGGDRDEFDEEDERFLVDAMCGTLARYLRMCGYDAAYTLDRNLDADDDILGLARDEHRRILTRDRELAARDPDAIFLDGRDVRDQLETLTNAGISLELPDEPRRCGACNGVLERVQDGTTTPEYAPDPSDTAVWKCVDCDQCFWRGSHWDDVAETLASV